MIGTIQISVNAANPNLPLKTLFSYVDSPSSIRVIDVPKKIGKWNITEVIINATYPDNQIVSAECVLVGGCWVGTIQGSSSVGKSFSGYSVVANGIDENGNGVTGYVLGKGDVVIIDSDGRTIIDGKVYYLHLIDGSDIPENPKEGDVILEDGNWKIYHNDEWIDFGGKSPSWGVITGDIENQTDLIEKFNSVDEKIDDVVSDVTNLSGDVDDVTNDVVEIKNDISAIQSKIPSQASSSNQLADKNFVNSSIATNTANFLGTFNEIEDFPESATPNDYVFLKTLDDDNNTIYQRYKWDGSQWRYEYTLNNSSFTSSQWSTINSGITESDKSYIDTLPEEFQNIRQEVADDIQDVYVVIEAVEDEFYRKTDQDTMTFSGEYEDGSTFSFNLLYLK